MERETADTFSLSASTTEVVTASSDRSGPTMLVPPETLRMTGVPSLGSMEARSIPLVSMSASVYGRRGSTVFHGSSSLLVGPRK